MPTPPTPKRLSDLSAPRRRRLVYQVLIRATALGGVLFAAYYLLPLEGSSDPHAVLRLVGGVAAFLAVVAWDVRRIKVSEFPQVQAMEALLGALPLFLLTFASTYLTMSVADPSAFSETLDHTDALYFTSTVLSTVGFGDITPVSAEARLVVTAQMLLDLILIAVVVRVVMHVTEKRLSRGEEPHPG